MTSVTYSIQPPLEPPALPYFQAAPIYLEHNLKPIPVRGKILLVKGATGARGVVTERKIKDEWMREFPDAGTALRAEGWVGIDCDEYGDKHGAEQLKELESKWGKLPPTYSSTSRGQESPSRIYFFRIPEDYHFVTDPTPDIEIIQRRHRYAVVAPSKHPETGREYTWYAPDGEGSATLPRPEDFAELPENWVNGLMKGARQTDEDGRDPFGGELTTWEEWLNDEEPTPGAAQLIQSISARNHIGHAELLDYLLLIHTNRKDYWERGVKKALVALRERYLATTNEPNPEKEWTNAARWVIGKDWVPEAISNVTIVELSRKLFSSPDETAEREFWQSRQILRDIYKLGRQKTIAPWSLLGLILQRVLHTVPWNVYYETYKGPTSLNTLLALVGRTGTGKSTSLDVIDLNITFNDSNPDYALSCTWQGVVEPGSGEAMPDYYMTTTKDENKKPQKTWAHPNRAAMFGFDEVGMLEGRQAREGSTITEYMKQGCSGTVFGRVLKGGGGTMLPSRSYRFGLFINVQPARAGLLFTPNAIAGGLPSRFLFFSTQDKALRSEQDFSKPVPIVLPQINWSEVSTIRALPVMDEMHRDEQFKANEGKVEEIDSHLLLTRAKVAVALAVMEGRTELNEEDWELSKVVITHSVNTRKMVLDELSKATSQELARAGRAAGTKTAIAEEVVMDRQLRTTAKAILKKRADGLEDSEIRRTLNNRSRPFFNDALSFLEENPDWSGEKKP